jgi:prophage regulatory protein
MNRSNNSSIKHTEPGKPTADHCSSVQGTLIDNLQPAIRLLPRQEVERRTGLSRSTIYALMKSDQLGFPKPIRVSFRRVAWMECDVSNWITARVAASRSKTGDPE